MDAKSGNLHLHLVPYAKAACLQVMIGFKVKNINWFVLNKLKRGEPCGCPSLAHGSEATSLAFSLYKYIIAKLNISAGIQEKSKAVNIQCFTQNEMFFITLQTLNNGSALRKVLSLVEKNLEPEKLFPYYKACIKLLNGSASREEFISVANEMNESLSKVVCLVSGKINLDQAKLKMIVEAAAGKFKPKSKLSGGKTCFIRIESWRK